MTSDDKLTIAGLRKELDQSLEEFAETLGLKSKSSASELETSGRGSQRVALALEKLSGGRLDAAEISDDVALARADAA